MQIEQRGWTCERGWEPIAGSTLADGSQLVFVFGSGEVLRRPEPLADLRARYPHATLFGCSTSGEIADVRVLDHTVIATALHFDSTHVRSASTVLEHEGDSRDAGHRLAAQLPHEGLSHVFVLSEGLKVNGSQLVEGLTSRLPSGVAVTGGLAGDGTAFTETLVLCHDRPKSCVATAVGLYSTRLRIGYASLGGYDSFGPDRVITRAEGNVLFELDGQSALELYKRYLGDHAKDLPSSGLLFPLSVRSADGGEPLVRTILAVDEAHQSMTFAGDMPVGGYARLMKANFDRLIDGATAAAKTSATAIGTAPTEFALLISCVGRRLVLKQRTEEEVEAVRDVVGPGATMTGFYSYGEISPFTPEARCQLHNQTMTVTTLAEC